MKTKKREKLVLVSPIGKEYEIGFLSPCTDGFVLGTSQTKKEESSHLTILRKSGKISAHITPQKSSKQRQYFIPLSIEEFTARIELLIENKAIFQLSHEQLLEEVMYVTVEFEKWYNTILKALVQKKETEKEITHYLNFKNLCNKLPDLVDMLKSSLPSCFGVCKAKDILTNDSIIAGITNSNTLIVPIEKELIGIDLRVFTNFMFFPLMDKSELSDPWTEFLQSIGITSYIQQEVIEKKFLENLLSKENWQARDAELGSEISKRSHS